MVQEDRPAACALCPIKTGPHAMHPLYDASGKEGRQVVDKNNRLAWVHTLCAMYHCSHSGYVYGCDQDGETYDADKPADDANQNHTAYTNAGNDDKKESSVEKVDATSTSTDDNDDAETTTAVSAAYFVIGGKERGKDEEWAKQTRANILNARKDRCVICNKKDNIHGILRIPVECSAGSKYEPHQLMERRAEKDAICRKAVHVGCARWGLNARKEEAKFRRVYYHPGLEVGTESNGEKAKVAVACYCNKHAKEVKEGKTRNKKRMNKKRRIIVEEEEEGDDANDDAQNSND